MTTTPEDLAAEVMQRAVEYAHGHDRAEARAKLHAAIIRLAAMASSAQQGEPVAWCALTPSGQIAYFDGKPMVMPGPVGNECHPVPMFTRPTAPADLRAFLDAAAGEGLVLAGIDAADLCVSLFPEHYAALQANDATKGTK